MRTGDTPSYLVSRPAVGAPVGICLRSYMVPPGPNDISKSENGRHDAARSIYVFLFLLRYDSHEMVLMHRSPGAAG